MPELPEVEVVRRGLARWVAGRTVAAVEVAHPRAVRRHAGRRRRLRGPAAPAARSTGASRRGKYLWLPLADGPTQRRGVLAHLGMSGQLLVRPPGQPRRDATCGSGSRSPTTARSCASSTSAPSAGWPWSTWSTASRSRSRTSPATRSTRTSTTTPGSAALRRRRTGLKRALLDQSLVSGIGNIYADEALWRARLHWARADRHAAAAEGAAGARTRPAR